MANLEVIGLGAMNLDYLCQVERILEDGEAPIKAFTLSPGGSAANTVYGLAKLGIRTGFFGAVGDDDDGDILLGSLELAGVDVSSIKTKIGADTGKVIGISDELGHRSLYVLPGANNLLSIDDIEADYLNHAELVHISSFAETKQLDASIEAVRSLSSTVKVSFAPGSLYAKLGLKRIMPILERTHILFINSDEVNQLTGRRDILSGAKTLLKRGCEIIVVTLGGGMTLETGGKNSTRKIHAAGYILSADGEIFVQPRTPEKMKIIDTTGAGDAFAAGFLFGWLQKKSLEECGLLGDLMARYNMTRPGARQSLPTQRTLLSTYRRVYQADEKGLPT